MEMTFQPSVLRWARERAGLTNEALAEKLRVPPAQVQGWEQAGALKLALAEKLAKATHTPLGFLFLATPPDERLPIPDFRTVGDAAVRQPSPDLIETIQTMQRRQAWMRDFLVEEGHEPLPFVGSASPNDQPRAVALAMRETLGLQEGWANEVSSWSEALLFLREKIEAVRILIFINGIVGNNTRRKLDPNEFRGFALSDAVAPLIFINGADAKSAQMFSFAHELAHVWLGQGGVSDLDPIQPQFGQSAPIERFCNTAAAEFVVPQDELRARWAEVEHEANPFQRLARSFKVSPIVAARRALDLSLISREEFFAFYNSYVERERQAPQSKGGNFWNTQNVRVGKRFGSAVVRAAKEGRLLYQQAYQLTDLRSSTFDKFAKHLGY
jgi:Zn-dependent peptidase ImmA (M78 family)